MRAALTLLLAWLPLLAGAAAPNGPFTHKECLGCHATRDAKLVADWRASGHARKTPKADCLACHGTTHAGSLARARRDESCSGCHTRLRRETVHSYETSKHAVIMRLEQAGYDWSRPLARGNYRAPGCAYCHMHAGEHDSRRAVTPWTPFADPGAAAEPARGAMQAICGECHAPRYVLEQTGVGARMLEVARMKLREARDLIAQQKDRLANGEREAIEAQLAAMREHGRNVRLGAGHQSPDYQWWHGQPALDGDLLRIKGLVSEANRRRGTDTVAAPAK